MTERRTDLFVALVLKHALRHFLNKKANNRKGYSLCMIGEYICTIFEGRD